jgi:hypothetical protein
VMIMIEGIQGVAIVLTILLLFIFLLECTSTDLISSIVFAIPFCILFFLIMSFFPELDRQFQVLISILEIVTAVMIMVNIMKSINS